MGERPYAEVVGDPVAHSLSPAIHGHWLAALDLDAGYRATRVPRGALSSFLVERRRNVAWRGCNVTAPHKEAVVPLLDRLTPAAASVEAVNCITSEEGALFGHNTDVEGIAQALAGVPLLEQRAVVIGAGGAARAAVHVLLQAGVAKIVLLVREPGKTQRLRGLAPGLVEIAAMASARDAMAGASLVVNATPMGMARAEAMPDAVLAGLSDMPGAAAAFDMVYAPLTTPFLAAAEAAGRRPIDGLTMLVGQARGAFRLFFGAEPPHDDAGLRSHLAAVRPGLASPAASA